MSTETCIARRYGIAGKNKKYNKALDKQQVLTNQKNICDALKQKPLQCASTPQCLWASEGERFELEGPTVKSLKQVHVEVASSQEAAEMLKTRGLPPQKVIVAAGKMTDLLFKTSGKIVTFDAKHVGYEVEYTDFDRHTKFDELFAKSLSKTKQKQPPKEEEQPNTGNTNVQLKVHKHKVQVHHEQGLQKKVSREVRRRRLAPVAGNVVNTPPYSSVGLIATVYPNNYVGMALRNQQYSVATGTIIHVTGGNPKHIYVLAAAHDIVKIANVYDDSEEAYVNRIVLYAPFEHFKFYPYFVGTENERRQFNVNGRNVGALERAWLPMVFNPDGRLVKTPYDIAVLRFEVPQAFNVPAIGINIDPNLPLNGANDEYNPPNALNHNKQMIMYDVGGLAGGPYAMHHQQVNIYCKHGGAPVCMYQGVTIKQGYCGGPIIHGGGITAMQASRTPINYDNAHDCDNANPQNCIGYAAKMTAIRKTTIELIYKMDARVGRMPKHRANLMEEWENAEDFIYAVQGMENMFDSYEDDMAYQQLSYLPGTNGMKSYNSYRRNEYVNDDPLFAGRYEAVPRFESSLGIGLMIVDVLLFGIICCCLCGGIVLLVGFVVGCLFMKKREERVKQKQELNAMDESELEVISN